MHSALLPLSPERRCNRKQCFHKYFGFASNFYHYLLWVERGLRRGAAAKLGLPEKRKLINVAPVKIKLKFYRFFRDCPRCLARCRLQRTRLDSSKTENNWNIQISCNSHRRKDQRQKSSFRCRWLAWNNRWNLHTKPGADGCWLMLACCWKIFFYFQSGVIFRGDSFKWIRMEHLYAPTGRKSVIFEFPHLVSSASDRSEARVRRSQQRSWNNFSGTVGTVRCVYTLVWAGGETWAELLLALVAMDWWKFVRISPALWVVSTNKRWKVRFSWGFFLGFPWKRFICWLSCSAFVSSVIQPGRFLDFSHLQVLLNISKPPLPSRSTQHSPRQWKISTILGKSLPLLSLLLCI
jgi:hypothetical protein